MKNCKIITTKEEIIEKKVQINIYDLCELNNYGHFNSDVNDLIEHGFVVTSIDWYDSYNPKTQKNEREKTICINLKKETIETVENID